MSRVWVGADQVLSSYADDLDDPRAVEEAERIRRAHERARTVVEDVLARQGRDVGDEDADLIDLENDGFDEDDD